MIHQDVMITYNRKTKLYRFYADGREIKIKDDVACVCLLLQNAVKEGNYENHRRPYSTRLGEQAEY